MSTIQGDRGLIIIEQALRFSVVASLVVVLASLSFFDWLFAFSVFLGSAFATGNLLTLRWIARRWLSGRRGGMLPVLFGKLWLAILLLFLVLNFLPVEISGIIMGMVASLGALLWGALIDGGNLIHEATEGSKDA